MGKFFVRIYDFFEKHKTLFRLLLAGSLLFMLFFALRINFREDISSFFPGQEKDGRDAVIFTDFKMKDRIVVIFSPADTLNPDPDLLIDKAQQFEKILNNRVGKTLVTNIISEIDAGRMSQTIDYIYAHLPVFLDNVDYRYLDSITQPAAMEQKMIRNYHSLISPMGMVTHEVIKKDPLGMGNRTLSKLSIFNQYENYSIYDNHIFTESGDLLMFIDPRYGMSNTSDNDRLITAIENTISDVTLLSNSELKIEYYGGPSVAVYNARQIKKDIFITVNIALIIIIVFILLSFRRKRAVFLVVFPVVYGGLFALCGIYFFAGQISSIAIGAGSAVLGIALSYSIHVISHSNHVADVRQIIRELAQPLTIGSFTTIGAFLALLFTNSPLLRDFGLFSSLSLIGTTLFCLIFLPHFIKSSSNQTSKEPWLLRKIEKLNSYNPEKNRWLIAALIVITIVSLFFFNDVKFNSDMMSLNYEPDKLKVTREKLEKITGGDSNGIMLIAANRNADAALESYAQIGENLVGAIESGEVTKFVSASDFAPSTHQQQARIEKWKHFWTVEKKAEVIENLNREAQKLGFSTDSFSGFSEILNKNYEPQNLVKTEAFNATFGDWAAQSDSLYIFIAQLSLSPDNKADVYPLLIGEQNVTIVDRAYFIGRMAQDVSDNFYIILTLSSLLIFFALLLSYGRIELALMAFAPMFLSWIIILAGMAILGIEFNIVNIILSTFIFGIGDDFSIFVMDGLLSEYKNGKKILTSHKTAIFFSAVAIVIGMGSLIFARHPAIKSISAISLLGIVAVVCIAYILQPLIFNLFISSPTKKGNMPVTFMDIVRSLYVFLFFVLGCIFLSLLALVSFIIPANSIKKRAWLQKRVCYFVRFFLKYVFFVRFNTINESGETFDKPSIIIANHQSFVDLMVVLALSPKIVIVANKWVWNSPFFGLFIRRCGFIYSEMGYENMDVIVKERFSEGCSVLIFPEGTRSPNCEIQRFHKGAFFLAEKLQADIVPVIFYGNGLIISKKQPLMVTAGMQITKILPRIAPDDSQFGTEYRERTKKITAFYREQFQQLYNQYNNSENRAIYARFIKNYIYKGPILEWYMRIKSRMEKRYRFFDRLLPREAFIVNIGCGYGPLDFMLKLSAKRRRILAVDYDQEKIALARHSFSHTDIDFVHADATTYNFPAADVFVMNDVLHYLNFEEQEKLIARCAEKLNPRGMIVVRDGDSAKSEKHKRTETSEKWSTKIIGFNKTEHALCFFSSEMIHRMALQHNLLVKEYENDKFTSNTCYVLRKKG